MISWHSIKQLGLGLIIIIIDQITKYGTYVYLRPSHKVLDLFAFDGIPIFQKFLGIDFCLRYITNRGAIYGWGESYQIGLLLMRIGLILGAWIFLLVSTKPEKYRYLIGLIIAGGIGNVIDYFTYGHVIDMLHFTFWGYSYPVFNVADIAICIGMIGLIFYPWIQQNHASKSKNQ